VAGFTLPSGLGSLSGTARGIAIYFLLLLLLLL
jgi:hypothetical protein